MSLELQKKIWHEKLGLRVISLRGMGDSVQRECKGGEKEKFVTLGNTST